MPFSITQFSQDMKAPAPDSDFEDDDDGDFGRLGSEHVEKLHFGGGETNNEESGKLALSCVTAYFVSNCAWS